MMAPVQSTKNKFVFFKSFSIYLCIDLFEQIHTEFVVILTLCPATRTGKFNVLFRQIQNWILENKENTS